MAAARAHVISSLVLGGVGLHTGLPARVTLAAEEGPVRVRANGVEARVRDLRVASTRRSTTVTACGGRLTVGTVEHAFAAFAGLGIHDGCVIAVEGSEMPLLDGGAGQWCDALVALGVGQSSPRVRVARDAVIEVGASRYDWAPGPTADIGVRLEVSDPRIAPEACWTGDPRDFRTRIAEARTFALARDLEELAEAGLGRHVDPTAVVVIAPDAIHCAGRPFSSDEPARHKLLNLLGDMYLFGGPALGRLRALRPGHGANVRAMGRAWAEGVLVDATT